MKQEMQKIARLPRNFHRTFIPERQYINAMLKFAAAGKSGDYQEICAETGIPTGVSTGKVPAILDYCRGMGLVELKDNARSAVKSPRLTPFGRTVLIEDPHMKEQVTQWLAHLNLCAPATGADVWFHTFVPGTQVLGMRFSRTKLEEYLALVYKTKQGGIIGPLIRMYEDDASFQNCGALSECENIVARKPAPISEEYARGYGIWLVELMTKYFPGAREVTLTELDTKSGWRTIPGWAASDVQRVLSLIERCGFITVDRHMDPWIMHPKISPIEGWPSIYDDLI
jgi:hypothetical protein